jgi:hypothetical protein
VFYVGFPQAAVIGIVTAFELWILEIFCKINLDQTVGIHKNNLNRRRLKCESLISVRCTTQQWISYLNPSEKDNLQKYIQWLTV